MMKFAQARVCSFAFYLAAIIGLAGGTVGCSGEDPWTTVKPKTSDLSGVYEYASDTLHAATKPVPKKNEIRRLTLYPNGTFVAAGVPLATVITSRLRYGRAGERGRFDGRLRTIKTTKVSNLIL
jgi:hypothetical protein